MSGDAEQERRRIRSAGTGRAVTERTTNEKGVEDKRSEVWTQQRCLKSYSFPVRDTDWVTNVY